MWCVLSFLWREYYYFPVLLLLRKSTGYSGSNFVDTTTFYEVLKLILTTIKTQQHGKKLQHESDHHMYSLCKDTIPGPSVPENLQDLQQTWANLHCIIYPTSSIYAQWQHKGFDMDRCSCFIVLCTFYLVECSWVLRRAPFWMKTLLEATHYRHRMSTPRLLCPSHC